MRGISGCYQAAIDSSKISEYLLCASGSIKPVAAILIPLGAQSFDAFQRSLVMSGGRLDHIDSNIGRLVFTREGRRVTVRVSPHMPLLLDRNIG